MYQNSIIRWGSHKWSVGQMTECQSRLLWRICTLGNIILKIEVGKEHFEYVYLPSSCWQQGISWTWTKTIFTFSIFVNTNKKYAWCRKEHSSLRITTLTAKCKRNLSLWNACWNVKPFLNPGTIPNPGQFNCEVQAGSFCAYYPFNHPFSHHLAA